MRSRACFVASIIWVAGACAEAPEATLGSQRQAVLSEVTSFGTNPAGLRMFTYVPAGMPSAPAPLVVALHGCMQEAADYENAGWDAMADRYKFYVVYPQIDTNYGCFHWFNSSDTARGSGEALSIKQMVDKMKADHAVDGARVFVTGLSSGGAMTAALLAAYPDVFSAGAPLAGIPVGCSASCMYGSQTNSAQQWGDAVRAKYAGYAGAWPRVSIWQGTSDSVVDFANFGELVSQWTNVHAVDAVADASETVGLAAHREYQDGQGKTKVESWELAGMDHGAPIDPVRGCGAAANYMLDVAICSSERIARFFGIVADPGPDAGIPAGLDAGLPGTDAATVVRPDASEPEPDAGAAGLDAGKKADGGAAKPVDPGQCNCGVTAGATESGALLVLLAGALRALVDRRRRP